MYISFYLNTEIITFFASYHSKAKTSMTFNIRLGLHILFIKALYKQSPISNRKLYTIQKIIYCTYKIRGSLTFITWYIIHDLDWSYRCIASPCHRQILISWELICCSFSTVFPLTVCSRRLQYFKHLSEGGLFEGLWRREIIFFCRIFICLNLNKFWINLIKPWLIHVTVNFTIFDFFNLKIIKRTWIFIKSQSKTPINTTFYNLQNINFTPGGLFRGCRHFKQPSTMGLIRWECLLKWDIKDDWR